MQPPPLYYSQTWITSWLFLLLESNLYVLIHGILYGTSNLRMYPRGRPSIKSRFFNRSGRASKGSLRKPS